MPPLLRTIVAGLVGLALLVPASGGAQEPPPDELVPPPGTTTPTQPEEPVVEIEPPPTVTIKVPPLREPTASTKKVIAARPEPVRRTSPSRNVRVSEPAATASNEPEPSAVEPESATERPAKPKPHKKKVQRATPRMVAKATASPTRTIRDPDRAGAVLAAQFTLGDDSAQGIGTGVVVLAIMIAALLGGFVGVVGAAPLLADRWPKVFVPVIDATDRIVVAGVCLAGAALTVAITWVLSGPGR